MSENLFKQAYLDLDVDGSLSKPPLRCSPWDIYWRYKLNLMDEYNLRGKIDFFSHYDTLQIPLELAEFLKIGDIITFIQEEGEEDDIFIRFYLYKYPTMKERYLEWKDFLANNGIGIFIYGREVLMGKSSLYLQCIYYDQNAVFSHKS